MGYYTTYRLELDRTIDFEQEQKIIEEFRNSNESAQYALDCDGDVSDSTKWYDHEKELSEFSLRYPKVLFTLYGDGEEQGDSWIKYVINGEIQVANAKITYDDFDENKLERKIFPV